MEMEEFYFDKEFEEQSDFNFDNDRLRRELDSQRVEAEAVATSRAFDMVESLQRDQRTRDQAAVQRIRLANTERDLALERAEALAVGTDADAEPWPAAYRDVGDAGDEIGDDVDGLLARLEAADAGEIIQQQRQHQRQRQQQHRHREDDDVAAAYDNGDIGDGVGGGGGDDQLVEENAALSARCRQLEEQLEEARILYSMQRALGNPRGDGEDHHLDAGDNNNDEAEQLGEAGGNSEGELRAKFESTLELIEEEARMRDAQEARLAEQLQAAEARAEKAEAQLAAATAASGGRIGGAGRRRET